MVKYRLFSPDFVVRIKLCLTIFLLYLFYLVILPILTQYVVPCLRYNPLASYNDKDCTVGLALDRFMTLALIGYGLLTFILWLVLKRKFSTTHPILRLRSGQATCNLQPTTNSLSLYLPFLITSILMAVSLIITYHLFIPTVEAAVRKTPIILESLK